jgi:hypothetical protein
LHLAVCVYIVALLLLAKLVSLFVARSTRMS